MILNILLAVSAITVAVAEFFLRGKNENEQKRLNWVKIVAAFVVFSIGTYKAIEPSLMEYQADKYFANGEYAKAISNYKKLELTDPENMELLSKIAQIYRTFAGQARERVLRDEFLSKSMDYYARLSVYNHQALEPKLAMMSLFSIGGMKKEYTEYFILLRSQADVENYFKNYDGSDVSNQQLSELHRKLADYLAQAYNHKKLGKPTLKALGYPTSMSEVLLDEALHHLEKAKTLNPTSQGVLITDSQLSLMKSRKGDINSNKNIDYLQRSFNSAALLYNIKTPVKHRPTTSTRIMIKVLLDPRVSKINTEGFDLNSVAQSLEEQTEDLSKEDEGYFAEASRNATYLFQAYKEIGDEEKYKKWESQVVTLRGYLTTKRRLFLCRKFNVAC